MSARCPLRRRLLATATGCLLVAAVLVTAVLGGTPAASAATNTTAWQNGAFSENTGGVVSRSDVFLGQPNTADSQSLPLGNGSLGVAAWAAGGFTAQLNRSDTMPNRLSPGQVQIPGLAAMTSASNFTGTLDLYNGVLNESGGGMTMQAWVPAGKDELIVNVTGANPSTQETADLHLWSGRSPDRGRVGRDRQPRPDLGGQLPDRQLGADVRGDGRDHRRRDQRHRLGRQLDRGAGLLHPERQRRRSGSSSRRPPGPAGTPPPTASTLIGSDATTAAPTLLATQSSWWNGYWANAGLIEANSSDGTAAVHGEPAHPLPVRRGRLHAQPGTTRAARPGSRTCSPTTRTSRTGTRPGTGCGTCAARSPRTCRPATSASTCRSSACTSTT